MSNLILHCGSEEVTREMVEAVPVPEHTDSWKPVPYKHAIDYLHQQAKALLGLEVRSERYGLNKKGDQMFGLLVLNTESTETGLSIGLRQSYNKSLALGVAVGSNVFVCDNLCFSGSAFKVVRKNTTNVWIDFQNLLTTQVTSAMDHYRLVEAENTKMKEIECVERRGYELLGIALGEGVLTPTQATVALGDWKEPRHEEFAARTLWSLYNCFTEGLKKGAPGHMLDRHVQAHAFFQQEVARA